MYGVCFNNVLQTVYILNVSLSVNTENARSHKHRVLSSRHLERCGVKKRDIRNHSPSHRDHLLKSIRRLLLLGGGGGLGDSGGGLAHEELDVARGAHEGGDATVGTVGAAVGAGSLIDLNVLDDHLGGLETLGDGVGLSVLEEGQHGGDGLARPATLGLLELLSLGGAADLTGVAAEGDAAGLGEDLAVELLGLAEGHAIDDVSSVEGVLEVAAEIGDLSVGGLGGDLGLARVVHDLHKL